MADARRIMVSKMRVAEGFPDELSRQLRQAMLGHVREIFLDRLGSMLFIHVHTDTYYGLQLAITAVEQLLSTNRMGLSVHLGAEVKGTFYRMSFAAVSSEQCSLPGESRMGPVTATAGKGERLE